MTDSSNIPQMPEPQPYGQNPPEAAEFPEFISNIGVTKNEAPKQSPPPAGKKRPRRRIPWLWIAVVVLAAGLTLCALFLWPGFLKPSGQESRDPFVASVEDVLKQNEAGRFFLTDKGTTAGVDLSISSIGKLMAMITGEKTYSYFPGEGKMGFTAGSGLKEGSFTLDASFMGLNLTAQVCYTEEGITFKVPELLGDDTYYLPLENMDQALSGSVFNPNSGTAYSLDQKTYNELLQILVKVKDLREKHTSAEETGLSDRLTQLLDEQGLPHTFTASSGQVDLNGETLDVEFQTLSLSTEDLLGYIQSLETLWNESTSSLSELAGGNLAAVDLGTLKDLIQENHFCVNIEYTVYQKRAILVNVHIYDSMNPMKNAYDLDIDFGKDPSLTDQVSITFGPSLGTAAFTALWKVKTNTEQNYSWDLEITNSGSAPKTVSFQWNKSTGEFSLQAGRAFSLSGSLSVDGKTLVFSPGTLVILSGEKAGTYDLSLLGFTITKDQKINKISGKSKDLFSLKEEEMDTLVNNIRTSSIGSLFFPNLSSAASE